MLGLPWQCNHYERAALVTPFLPLCVQLTAYHESGHAVVAIHTAGAAPIHKATITPRGNALGMVTQLPDKDEDSVSMRQMLARLDVCMGGRVAEEMIFGPDQVTHRDACVGSPLLWLPARVTRALLLAAHVMPLSFELPPPLSCKGVSCQRLQLC